MAPTVEKAIAAVDSAFRGATWPSKFALPGAYDEDLLDRELGQIPTSNEPLEIVRRHRNALHALTNDGLVSVLPHYLRAGLSFPKSEVMDHVVYFVTTASRNDSLRIKLAALSDTQREAFRQAFVVFKFEYATTDQFLSKEIDRALAALSSER